MQLLQLLVDLIDDGNCIGAGLLYDGKGNRRLPVHFALDRYGFIAIRDECDILQKYLAFAAKRYGYLLDVIDRGELADRANRISSPALCDGAARRIDILVAELLADVGQRNTVLLQLARIDPDRDFPLQSAGHGHRRDAVYPFQIGHDLLIHKRAQLVSAHLGGESQSQYR